MFRMDSVTSIIYVNPRWFHITGHNALAGGPSASGALQFRYKNGTWAQLELKHVTEFGPDVTLVGVVTDVTALKSLEILHIETVEQRAVDAETHRRHIEQFIDIASHEIRNPLSAVIQNAECLERSLRVITSAVNHLRTGGTLDQASIDNISSEMRENIDAVEAILICAAHQRRIADVSKLNMGLLTVNRTSFDVEAKLREVSRMFEADCNRKGLTLRVVLDESVATLGARWVQADPSRLAQCLQNFTLNAIKFTSAPGSITLWVGATSAPPPLIPSAMRVGQVVLEDTTDYVSPVWITCAVEDTGRGLTTEEREALFERFSQARPRTDQRVLKRQLTSHHFTVTLTSNGLEALEALQDADDGKAEPIDIVLMDIAMPVMDGQEAVRELRKREKAGMIKTHYNVICVTGNARREQVDEYLSEGFEDIERLAGRNGNPEQQGRGVKDSYFPAM
ncbi:hypothetical protein RQP46_003368 [Phenoliferia psychrophenolica]